MGKKKKAAFSNKKQKVPWAMINVTPLIDIVLVLLIICIVVTPVMTHQMDINLPEKTETVPEDKVPTEQCSLQPAKMVRIPSIEKFKNSTTTDSLRGKLKKKSSRRKARCFC